MTNEEDTAAQRQVRLDRCEALTCMAWAGTGLLWPEKPAFMIHIGNITHEEAGLPVFTAGATVAFVNADDSPHTAVAVDKTRRSKALDTGDTYSFTFVTQGVYDYFCALHSHMQGRVIVK